jgi:hypothetical protein
MKKYIMLSFLMVSGLITAVNAATASHYTVWQDGKIIHPKTAITKEQLTAILNSIHSKATDAEKLVVFKDSLKNKGIMVEQVITLMHQMNEDAKYEAAIYAFQYTTDFKKYDRIQDLFGVEAHKQMLQDYVDRHRK